MIKIRVDKSCKLRNEYSLFVSFNYDPQVVDIMRSFANRFYNPTKREWEIESSKFNVLQELLSGYTITLENEKLLLQKKFDLKKLMLEGFEFKTKPFEHQLESFKFAFENNSFILGDQQGLGKTKQIIDIAVAKKIKYGFKHCLIICGVNGLKYNWKNEVEKHSNEKAWILGTRFKKGKERIGTIKDRYEDLYNLDSINSYFLITNMETLRANTCEKMGKRKKYNFYISERIQELIEDGTIGLVAFDEVHKCKDPNSLQGKSLLKIKPKFAIPMSGTPLMNSPLDLYVPLNWIGVENHSFYAFKNHYCRMGGFNNKQVMGTKNLDQLRAILDKHMLRRLKDDVLDLPPKICSTVYVEMENDQKKIYNEVLGEIKRDIDKIRINPDPLSQLLRLRQATGYPQILTSKKVNSAKVERLKEILQEIINNGEKAIIFSQWTSVVNPVYEELKMYNPAIITGDVKNREEQKDKFMNNNLCKVIIGTIGAMGTGLTLTEASTVIFLDSPWTKANKEQAEDRAHRIGTKGTVNIITLVTKGTIDERIEDIVYKKGEMADYLVDGKVNRSKLFDSIIEGLTEV